MSVVSQKPNRRGSTSYTHAVLATGLCSAAAWLLDPVLDTANLALVFLTGVLVAALRGVGPAVVAGAASFVILNVFFTEPRYTFFVHARQDVVTLGFFLLVALITGQLAARAKRQVDVIRAGSDRLASLAAFSRRLAGAAGQDDVAKVLVDYLQSTLSLDAIVLFPDYASTLVVAAGDTAGGLTDVERDAANFAFERREPAGLGTRHAAAAAWFFVPLVGNAGAIGVFGVRRTGRRGALTAAERDLLYAMRDQARTALERMQLATAIERTRFRAETDKLRTALLSSVSHDLRTPLVSIKGTTTALLQLGDVLAPDDKRELLENVLEEAERLNRYVQNLLDMTRLGYGTVAPRLEWRDVREIIGNARRALKSILGGRRAVTISIRPGDELIHTDALLLEQVVVNLLENAVKHSGDNEAIEVDGRRGDAEYRLSVCDRGPGVPPAERERVFDLFARARTTELESAGTGIGLAICKGFVEALGGTIEVRGRGEDPGACFRLCLPQPRELPPPGAAE